MAHGSYNFDKEYYKRFHLSYDQNELAIYYRWFSGWINFLDRHVEGLKKGKSRDVLEIGCSIGAFSKILKERSFRVTATDISAYIIGRARKLQRDVEFKTLDVEQEIKISKKFSFIFAFEVLEHLKDPQKALIRIHKKLGKDGVFIFSTPFPTSRSLSDPTHISVHNPEWWLKACRKAGFSETKLVYATFAPFLYRYSSFFSWGFPVKTDIPYVNSTCIFICKK